MLTRLSLCLALAAALGGCASYESRYYDEQVVYRDGDYYVPADADRGDYYYAPDDYGYEYDDRYGYLPYAPYDPAFGFAGFDGYCPVAYAGCLPWWAGSYLDPRFRFAFGYGWSLGYVPIYGGYGWGYWGMPPYYYEGHRDHRHDGRGDHDHDRNHDRGQVTPPPAIPAAPGPDVSQPAPVERMPRPVFGGRVKDPRPEPVPARPWPAAPTDLRPSVPTPPPDDERLRWRDRRPEPAPVSPVRARPPMPTREPTPSPEPAPRRWRDPPARPEPPAPPRATVPELRRDPPPSEDPPARRRRPPGSPPSG